jgi:DNA-binding MurR/RpiR family transcriptional regulator
MSTIVISYQGNEDHYQHYHASKISLLTLVDTTFQAVIQRYICNTGQTKQLKITMFYNSSEIAIKYLGITL